MVSIPESTKSSVRVRLVTQARAVWPGVDPVARFRSGFVYVDAVVGGDKIKLCRLRYVGYANNWGFAIWRASHEDYQDTWLPSGYPSGSVEEALDTACMLYLPAP